ncbi:MAG: hypothetical protein KAI69_00665 [Deltaproteobacteria bacterium]|nr:hypothetical protein [Deltaproteobacteria bacterium]
MLEKEGGTATNLFLQSVAVPDFSGRNYLLVALYLLHHVFDGSAQIFEGRTWSKIIEISLRNGKCSDLSANFWVIYALSQNVHLLLGQFFLWGGFIVDLFVCRPAHFTSDHGSRVAGSGSGGEWQIYFARRLLSQF